MQILLNNKKCYVKVAKKYKKQGRGGPLLNPLLKERTYCIVNACLTQNTLTQKGKSLRSCYLYFLTEEQKNRFSYNDDENF